MKTAILKAALFTPLRGGRWGLPILCWGEPGVAKTALVEDLAMRWGLPCETLSPSERGEGAFGVVPVPGNPDENGNMLLTYPAPEWTKRFGEDGAGLVFVDEATSTPPALQAPLMGLILARRIGGVVLPKRVRILSAANPVDLAAGGYELSAPVANRMGHLEWSKPTVEEHVQFMLRGESLGDAEDFNDATVEERRVLAEWPHAWAVAVGYETAFLQRRPACKNMCPKAGDPKASRAWASDRTWEMATRAYASATVHGLSDTEREIFVEAFIGHEVASEFFEFISKQDLPDPALLLDGKEKFAHNPQRIDRTVAVLAACTALVSPAKAEHRKDRGIALWKMMESICDKNKADLDIIIPAAHGLVEAGLQVLVEGAMTLSKIRPVLKAANVKQGNGRQRL